MKVAIVHDWLNGMRGGEKVLETLLELYPDSTIYTLFYERGRVSPAIASRPIVTSWLNRVPGVYRYYRNMLPLFPAAVASLKLDKFDLVISSSHATAKCVDPQGALHISYCHSPMRYLWDAEADYRMDPMRRIAFSMMRSRLRRWDRESSQRVDHFIANSQFVRDRIRRYYGRDAVVIYPPVDTRFFTPKAQARDSEFYLAAGALVPYKRVDLVIRAFNKSGKVLVVAGDGPELKRLRRMAASNVHFKGAVSDRELRGLYRHARALVFAGREDFGITPVEAQACGCPVIAFAAGGVLETVRDGVSGLFFAKQDPLDIVRAIQRFESMTWTEDAVRAHVESFSNEIFKNRIQEFIEAAGGNPARTGVLQLA